jgi:uncharacterized protein (DUF58 family)
VTAFTFPWLISVGKYLLWIFLVITLLDGYILFAANNGIIASRAIPAMLSNGDQNDISIHLQNNYNFNMSGYVIDEIPFVFQIRDFKINFYINRGMKKEIIYSLYPKTRGEYEFGDLNIFVRNPIGLIYRRYKFSSQATAAVYPSIIQMRAYDIYAISNRLTEVGIKKIRNVGHTMEFEQIRNYVIGDDYRTVNWKATARKHRLMVNQYEDEKSQQVYSVIDMGRNMKMPFNGMTLLDYAINSSLVLSNIVIKKYDKAGLITFSNQIGTILPASARNDAMTKILQALYKQQTQFFESDLEKLYTQISYRLKQRSLILLFTNIESFSALERNLHIFRKINTKHMLMVIIFENSELVNYKEKPAVDIEDIYKITVAEKLVFEKKQIVKELANHGIKSILVQPQQLTIAVINKYLELKARALI